MRAKRSKMTGFLDLTQATEVQGAVGLFMSSDTAKVTDNIDKVRIIEWWV
jgi:hypothetical protein